MELTRFVEKAKGAQPAGCNYVMKKLLLLPALGMLVFLVACGGSGNAGFGGSTVGDFSEASVSGNYTYQLAGTDVNTGAPFRGAGAFTADGKGHITAGEDDFAEGTTLISHTITSGSYSVSNDGTGDATLNFANGGGIHVFLTVANASTVYLTVDAVGLSGSSSISSNGYGAAELQTTSAFSAAPSGTFVFRRHTVTASQTNSISAAGVFSVSNGVVTGTEDINQLGSVSALTLSSGTFNAPDSQGRGTGSFTDSNAVTSTFVYYVVNGNSLRLFVTDIGETGLGRAEAQSAATTFSNASLSGGYAFGANGDDSVSLVDGIKTVGRFTADGGGNLTDGVLDLNEDGTPLSNQTFTGTYNIASNGRGTGTLVQTGGNLPVIFYLVSSSRAFFLVNDPTVVEDGTLDGQSTSSFSNSSMNGQYAFYMDGFDTSPDLWDWIGWLRGDGSGNLASSEFIFDTTGSASTGIVSGHYSVSANGRATGSINNGIFNNSSTGLVFYLVSGSNGYVMQTDQGFQVSGFMTKQQAP